MKAHGECMVAQDAESILLWISFVHVVILWASWLLPYLISYSFHPTCIRPFFASRLFFALRRVPPAT